MKRYILPLLGIIALPMNAQNISDAVRYGSDNISGTARYRAMGGAFGALGGDPSSMSDNPAGMGIYRGTSEISFTPNLSFAHSHVDGFDIPNGALSYKSKQTKADCSVSNLAYIISFKTDNCEHLVNFNFGVGFNHKDGVSRRYKMILEWPSYSFGDYLANRANNALLQNGHYGNPAYLESDEAWKNSSIPLSVFYGCGIDGENNKFNPDFPLLMNNVAAEGTPAQYEGVDNFDHIFNRDAFQCMYVTEKTRNDEYNINFSGNWEDYIYGGLTVAINDFNSIIETEFREDYQEDYRGEYTIYQNGLETKGTGIGIKAGVLIKPTDTWRIGFAAHTPTWYRMEDTYDGAMCTERTNYTVDKVYVDKYRYQSPWQMQLSSAWVLGNSALFSVEADMKDFGTQKYKVSRDSWENEDAFDDLNSMFKDYTKIQMTYKAGLEYRVSKVFSVRMGYAHKGSPYDKNLYDHPETPRSMNNGSFWDDNTYLFDSSTKPNHTILGSQQFYSGGIGWGGDWWHIDLSCVNRVQNEKLAAFPTTDAIYNIDNSGYVTMTEDPGYGAVRATYCDLKTRTLMWDLTFGMKF